MKYQHWMRFFLAPNTGGGSGGGSATNQPSGTSNGDSAGGNNTDDPWSKIDLDNLDDDSRAAVEALKNQFATLQTTVQQKDEVARKFQSEHDRTQAELARIKKGLQHVATGDDGASSSGPKGPPPEYVSQVEQQLLANGVNPQAAKAQAPIMANLLHAQEQNILARVGAHVGPVTNMVMVQQAENSFNMAKAQDTTGALSIPEVAQAVWNSASEIAQQGTPVTPETIANLKGMHFMAHAEKNPAVFATLQMNRVPVSGATPGARPNAVSVTTGGFNYPGANFAPQNHTAPDPNAPRTTLDPGTRHALDSIFSQMKPGHKLI